jgi:hypothetical protein
MNQTSAPASDIQIPDLIASALASLDEAGRNVWGEIQSGGHLYDSANPGWILGSVQHQGDNRSLRNTGTLATHFFVDHRGPGRRNAIQLYAETLRMAGLMVKMGPLREDSDREVVWIQGVPILESHPANINQERP